jgi:hypothetical protein
MLTVIGQVIHNPLFQTASFFASMISSLVIVAACFSRRPRSLGSDEK